MGKQRKSVIYVRVGSMSASSRQEELTIQEVECRSYAAKAGYTVAAVFADSGVSGETRNRKGLNDMLSFLGKADEPGTVVITTDLSRLSSKVGLAIETVSIIRAIGATVETLASADNPQTTA